MPQVNEHPEILLYTRIRKSPYYYASRRHGVQMYSVYNHTYHPRHYGDPVAEYWHLLNGVTLWDVGVERQIEISGPDAFDFTNLLVARDLNKCAVEQCKYVFLCLPDGGIINDPVLMGSGCWHAASSTGGRAASSAPVLRSRTPSCKSRPGRSPSPISRRRRSSSTRAS